MYVLNGSETTLGAAALAAPRPVPLAAPRVSAGRSSVSGVASWNRAGFKGFGLTESVIATLARFAGPTFDWRGESGTIGSRLNSAERAGLRVWLRDAQCGLCAFCGQSLPEQWEYCHIVSKGAPTDANGKRISHGGGWLASNIAAGCSTCNSLDNIASEGKHSIVSLATIVRADIVPLEWPDRQTLIGIGRNAERRETSAREREAIEARNRVRLLRGM